MTVKQAINKIKKEIEKSGYRENMCYPVFYELQKSIEDKNYQEKTKIENEFWKEYYKL